MRGLLAVFLLVLSIGGAAWPGDAQAFNKSIGKGYCLLRHPVESLSSDRTACESQHVIQRQSGGEDAENTIWINTKQHDYLDRSASKPWEYDRPNFEIGNDDIQRAYMIGTHSLGYNFFIYDHHGDGKLTLFKWDAATHFVYTWAAIVNLPQKEIGYLAYQLRSFHVGRETQFIDAIFGIIVDIIEVFFGFYYGVLGVFIGLILQPIDSMTNFFAFFGYLLASTFTAVVDLFLNIWSLVSFWGERAPILDDQIILDNR